MNKWIEGVEIAETDREPGEDLLPDENAAPLAGPAVTVGRLCALIPGTGPVVDFPQNESGQLVAARTTVTLRDMHVGSQVVLAFEDGDVARPIILGILQNADFPSKEANHHRPESRRDEEQETERLLITAGREITLRCGKASLTLTKAGKLLIEGEYVVSRSAGVNKIRGASVQIN